MASDLRRRGGGEHSAQERHGPRLATDQDDVKHRLMDHHFLNFWDLIVTLVYFSLVCLLIWCAHNYLPVPKPATIDSSEFSALRAREYLNRITGVGYHPAGSYENDVLTVNYLLQVMDRIKNAALPDYEIDVELQRPTGGFVLHFLWGAFSNTYNNVTNIVVHFYPKGTKPKHNILVNAHFDSQFKSEGASDDAVSCAIMLEMLSCLSRSKSLNMKHGVIFLFNGAEEALLAAGHGFISQYEKVGSIRAFVNLEASGSGGRELVFQTGPGHPWLVRTYAKSAVYPYASIVAQEVFQSGVIPSDTDFRTFRDHGNIPGIDIAYSSNGYVYHTRHDSANRIPDGSIQRAGENILAALCNLVSSPFVEDTDRYKHGKVVFFDVLGQFMVHYPWRIGMMMNLVLALTALIYIAKQVVLRDLMHHKGLDHSEHGRATAFLVSCCLIVTVLAIVAGFCVSLILAFVITKAGKGMSWFRYPSFGVLLYGLPCLTAIISVHSAAKKFLPQFYDHPSSIGHRRLERSCVYSHLVFASSILVYLTYRGILSSYFATLWVAFPLIGHCILYDHVLYPRGVAWAFSTLFFSHAVGHFVPAVLSGYSLYAVYDVFVPIFGRLGTEVNTDFAMCLVCCFTVSLVSLFMISFIYLVKNSKKLVIGLLLLSTVCFAAVFSNTITPYSGKEPVTPKRVILQHMDRRFHNEKGIVASTDSAVWVVFLDYLGLGSLKNLPALKEAQLVECRGVYCGLPFYYPMRFMVRKTWVIPAPQPVFSARSTLQVTKRESVDNHRVRIHLKVEGPSHMNLYATTKPNVRLVAWSLTKEDPAAQPDYNGGECYFVFHVHGYYAPPWEFWMEFQHPGAVGDAASADIALAGQFIDNHTSPALENIQSQLPTWTVDAGWLSSYDSWVI